MRIKKSLIITILILFVVGCSIWVYKYILSHEYIYVKDLNTSQFVKTSEIVELHLMDPCRKTLNDLKYCENLDRLYVYSEKMDLSFLNNLDLSLLQVGGMWDDYSGLRSQKNLKTLMISVDNFDDEDLTLLYEMNELEVLWIIGFSRLTTLDGIENLSNLQEISLGGTNIEDCSALLNCAKLRNVHMHQIHESVANDLMSHGVAVKTDKIVSDRDIE